MTQLPFRLDLEPPFLIVTFENLQRTLGWSITKPGFCATRVVVWLEVRNADLTPHVDPVEFLKKRLASRGLSDAAAFMTSREIRRHHISQSRVGSVIATCLTTVGLTNGERIGTRRGQDVLLPGTINTLVHVSRSLSAGAFVESISIATQARTAAIMETNAHRCGPAITGTGTDCILVSAPEGIQLESCAGLHTDLGEAIGAAVYDATSAGAMEWNAENHGDGRNSQTSDGAL
jgi:adenosylcobinamide amidohydrolase